MGFMVTDRSMLIFLYAVFNPIEPKQNVTTLI